MKNRSLIILVVSAIVMVACKKETVAPPTLPEPTTIKLKNFTLYDFPAKDSLGNNWDSLPNDYPDIVVGVYSLTAGFWYILPKNITNSQLPISATFSSNTNTVSIDSYKYISVLERDSNKVYPLPHDYGDVMAYKIIKFSDYKSGYSNKITIQDTSAKNRFKIEFDIEWK